MTSAAVFSTIVSMMSGLRVIGRRILPPQDPPHLEVRHGGDTFRVALRRIAAARRFTLRVSSATGSIVLTLPVRADLRTAADFARRHGDWIASRVANLPETTELGPGVVVPFRGVGHRIVHRGAARGTCWVEEGGRFGQILVTSGGIEHCGRRVRDFLKREAKKDLEAAVKVHCAALRVKATKITLRDTTSRWGSCSSTGRLNFSWRLIMAPPFVLDYLAAHEVAHLKEMNHSPRFWRLVERLCPRTDEAETWLKRHGPELHRFK
jgi:predicted metal-dependent hydrolase